MRSVRSSYNKTKLETGNTGTNTSELKHESVRSAIHCRVPRVTPSQGNLRPRHTHQLRPQGPHAQKLNKCKPIKAKGCQRSIDPQHPQPCYTLHHKRHLTNPKNNSV